MNKIVLIATPVLLIGGIIVAGVTGLVEIPGLTPKKSAARANLYGEAAKSDAEQKVPQKVKPVVSATPRKRLPRPVSYKPSTRDPEAGAKRLAKVWNVMAAAKVAELAKSWTDGEMAKVLVRMETEKAAALLELLPSTRASKLSRALQAEASVIKPTS